MRTPIIFLLLLFFVRLCYSQDAFKPEYLNDVLFSGNHYSLSLTPHLANKAGINNSFGPYRMKSSSVGGLEFGANFHSNLNNNFAIISGLHLGTSGRNYLITIPKEDFNPPRQYDYIDNGAISREFDFYFSAPILLEMRLINHSKNFWNGLIGLNIRYSISNYSETTTSYIEDSNNQLVKILQMELEVGNNSRPWINYNLGGGYNWLLKNNNILRANLLFNYSSKKVVKGGYAIEVPNQPLSNGNYSVDQSYLGIRISYILTSTNKRLTKLNKRRS
ncbi:MAG: hypothetical protein K2Q24_06970 [Chitinophagaceae bacterium]|jgi:hypothetical protein|nr:hypothetical protein [Chitinophagaceae bacterium]